MLHTRVRETNILLKEEMDELVRTLEEDEPDFVGQYFAARCIERTDIRHEDAPESNDKLSEILASSIEHLQTEPVPTPAPTTENGVTV